MHDAPTIPAYSFLFANTLNRYAVTSVSMINTILNQGQSKRITKSVIVQPWFVFLATYPVASLNYSKETRALLI